MEIKRGQTEDRAKIWEEAARLTFNFAEVAKYWFIPVKNKYPQIEAKYIRFELHNTKELERTAEQKQVFEEIKNELSGRRESNPQQKLGRLWFYH